MLYSFLYVVVRFVLETLIVRSRSEARLRAEVLALRHHLAVLERQVGRPPWQRTDRLVLAALSRVLPRSVWRSLLPRPETLLRWHRELVRRRWAAWAPTASTPAQWPQRASRPHLEAGQRERGLGVQANRW